MEQTNQNGITQLSDNPNSTLLDGLGLENGKPISTIPNNETVIETEEQKANKLVVEKLSSDEKTKYESLNEEEKKTFLNEKSNPTPAFKALELEGKTYKIDEKGNAVDESGKVIKTKEEIIAIASEQEKEETPLVVELIKRSGYTPLDEQGKPKQYEDTEEGLLSLTNDIATIKAKNAEKAFFEKFPDIAEYTLFRQQGHTAEEYFKRQSNSWSNVKLDTTDKEQLRTIVIEGLVKSGIDKKQAEMTAKLYEDTDQLKTFGEAAYNKLVKDEKTIIANEQQQYDQQRINYDNQVTAYWNNTKEIVNKGKLHSINIPEAERNNFFNYIAISTDENGNSQKDIALSKLTNEQRLELDYLVYKGLDLGKMIQNAIKTEQAQTLRMKISKQQQGAGGGQGVSPIGKPGDLDVSMDTLTLK